MVVFRNVFSFYLDKQRTNPQAGRFINHFEFSKQDIPKRLDSRHKGNYFEFGIYNENAVGFSRFRFNARKVELLIIVFRLY